ncbi:hypothetical protein A3844_27680 [Paenibacillus helianthi]|uniref:Uncharacterized protein n=1 Tax=Paenibacillus helianthi TaxID=1349432 RepID=A0ABX3EFE2_9BACL|nr:hypothetical protein [Paenibacillus helianthi]OKP79989.1 hypothetical protein A3844_27680 [Paenibacillus helianthi]
MELFNEKGEANSKPLTTEKVIEAMDIRGRTHLLSQQRRIKSELSKEEIAYLSEHRNEYPDMERSPSAIVQSRPDRHSILDQIATIRLITQPAGKVLQAVLTRNDSGNEQIALQSAFSLK